jgi:tRNA uridine 5-carboxymethylaminomethyl modification enzyme
VSGQKITQMISLAEILKRPHVHFDVLERHGHASGLSQTEKEAVEIELKYSGFIQRQQKQLAAVASKHAKKIPDDIDYDAIGTLSKESREKLSKMRPTTIGQASRLGGVSPADVSNLLIHLETKKRAAAGAERPQTIKEKRKVRVRAGHPSSIVHHLLARCSPSTTPARSPGPRRRGHEGPGSARARTVDSN